MFCIWGQKYGIHLLFALFLYHNSTAIQKKKVVDSDAMRKKEGGEVGWRHYCKSPRLSTAALAKRRDPPPPPPQTPHHCDKKKSFLSPIEELVHVIIEGKSAFAAAMSRFISPNSKKGTRKGWYEISKTESRSDSTNGRRKKSEMEKTKRGNYEIGFFWTGLGVLEEK